MHEKLHGIYESEVSLQLKQYLNFSSTEFPNFYRAALIIWNLATKVEFENPFQKHNGEC